MSWLIVTVIAALSGTLVLALVHFILFTQYRERCIGIWGSGWAIYALRFVFVLWLLSGEQSTGLFVGQRLSPLVGSLVLVWGVYAYLGRTMPRWWAVGCALGMMWVVIAASLGSSPLLTTLPMSVFSGAVFAWTGIVFLRTEGRAGIGRFASGWAFVVWGIDEAAYPLVQPVHWLTTWHYLIDAVLALVIAADIVLGYLRARKDSGEDEGPRPASPFDDLAMGAYRSTPAGQIVEASPALARMLGYPDRESLLAVNAADLYVDPRERARWQAMIDRQGVVQRFETQLCRPGGEIIRVRDSAWAVRDSLGRVRYYVGSLENVAARDWGVQPIKFAGLLTLTMLITLIVMSVYEWIKQLVHPGLTLWESHMITIVFSSLVATVAAYFGLRRYETLCQHAVEEMTLRQQAERAARESQRLLERTFASMRDAVLIVGAGTEIVDCNPRALEMFGYSRQQVVGRTPAFLHVDEAAVEAFRSHVLAAIQEQGYLHRFEFRMKRKDGTVFPTEHSIVPLEDGQGQRIGAVHVIRNITERKRAEGALRESLEEAAHGRRLLLALGQAAQAVQRARAPEEVYRTVLHEVAQLGYQAVILTLTHDREHLAVSHMTFDPALLRSAGELAGLSTERFRFPIVPDGLFQRVIGEGETLPSGPAAALVAAELPAPLCQVLRRLAIVMGSPQSIVAPLRIGDETYGLLMVTSTELTAADVPAITAFANQTAIALENARLFEQVHAGREQLRDLAGYLQAAREEERARIAREIHDEFGQALTALKMDVAWLSRRLPRGEKSLRSKTDVMSGLIDTTIHMVQHVSTELRPGVLDHLGLAAAIEWQAEDFAERTGIDCELRLDGEDVVLDRDCATAIFRIFQETLTNVARHAEATSITVSLAEELGEIVLTVHDDGCGIEESQVRDPKSLGLIGMCERARSWDGHITFQGAPGQGTMVAVHIPRARSGGGPA